MKFKTWDGKDLPGYWVISLKLDGVRAEVRDGIALSRAGKPLYNLPALPDGIYEVFKDNWETSVSLVRTKIGGTLVDQKDIYPLYPDVHAGLIMSYGVDFSAKEISGLLKMALADGYEGLVFFNSDSKKYVKVKPTSTYDVKVLKVIEGTGKYKGMMGAVITEKGKVGTGFTDQQRRAGLKVGTVIEVECVGLTPSGKFRHPRFKRERWDKS